MTEKEQKYHAAQSWSKTLFLVAACFLAGFMTAFMCLHVEAAPSEEVLQEQEVAEDKEEVPTGEYPIPVLCNSKTYTVFCAGGTVEDVLVKAGIDIGLIEDVSLPLHTPVRPGKEIVVTLGGLTRYEVDEEIPFETVAVPTSLLASGSSRVLTEGAPGLQVATYQKMGRAEPELVDTEIVREPTHEKVLTGEPMHPISPLDFGCALDENGEPVGYTNVLRNQRAAGYSAKVGAKTASGMDAVVGHVAVNPNVIPYGTRMYIKSTDGSFVYGYAVAADTGTAIRDGLIAVDLFYGSYMESALNGIKTVNIFILE